MEREPCLSRGDEEKLVRVYETLREFAGHDLPVVRFNCRKAMNELWQALFELDLIDENALPETPGIYADG